MFKPIHRQPATVKITAKIITICNSNFYTPEIYGKQFVSIAGYAISFKNIPKNSKNLSINCLTNWNNKLWRACMH